MYRLLLAAALVAAGWLLVPRPGAEAGTVQLGMPLPAPAGTTWTILNGYYTETHTGPDPFALDIERSDAPTGGTPVLAPVGGVVTFRGPTCIAVQDARGYYILICHLEPSLSVGTRVARGDELGVANARDDDNRWRAHLHIAVHRTLVRTNRYDTIPFAGPYALEGRNLPKVLQYNAYAGLSFVSSNEPAGGGGGQWDSVVLPIGLTHLQWHGSVLPPNVAFVALRDLVAVYAWRPGTLESRVYRPGSPRFLSTLTRLEPGDLLWLQLSRTAEWPLGLATAQSSD